MALTAPTPTVKLHPKGPKLHHLRNITHTRFNLFTKQSHILRTRTPTITTNDHCKQNATRIVISRALEKGNVGEVGEAQLLEVVDEQPRVVTRRIWNGSVNTILVAMHLLALHLLCVLAPFTFNWGALWVAIGLYVVTLLGITLSFHRHLAHKSFKIPKWLEYTFAYCGLQALQGDPIYWVRIHRYHHLYCDSEKDPHTPVKGFWFSYMKWMLKTDEILKACGEHKIVDDLEKQVFYKFLQKTSPLHTLALALILYALGGVPFVVWGMGVRAVCLFHVTCLVNAICHGHGQQSWTTDDLSRNIWWVAILSFGEGWHNNHHAFQYSARFGLKWWQMDIAWYTIRFLESIGLATDVKLPIPTDIQRRTSFKSLNPTQVGAKSVIASHQVN